MSISLIANSGIQFVDVKISLGEDSLAMKSKLDFYGGLSQLILPKYNPDTDSYYDPHPTDETLGLEIPEDEIDTFRFKQALQCFENRWLPIPYFRKGSGQELKDGPVGWSRIWFGAEPNCNLYNIVLAFDTSIDDEADTYIHPQSIDAQNTTFEVAQFAETLPLIDKKWCEDWLQKLLEERWTKIGIRGVLDESREEPCLKHVDLISQALFLLLLDGFGKAGAFPQVMLRDSNESEDRVIDVDLILDIGNSRSCGILMETSKPQEPVSFSNCSRLELRDLSIPHKKYDEPFEMRCEFVKTDFGDRSASLKTGDGDLFQWPSNIRVGPEALRLSVINSNNSALSGMSSPKRYLWDDQELRVLPWYFNEAENPSNPSLALFECYTEKGDVCARNTPDSAVNATYPRATLMKFVFTELLLHAISQINSHSFREHHGQSFFRRRLRRIVLTSPTAMLLTEKYRLRSYANDAVKALSQMLGEKVVEPFIEIVPNPKFIRPEVIADEFGDDDEKVDWGYDEATCVQLAFLYGEIHQRFMNDPDRFFSTYSHMRRVVNVKNSSLESYFEEKQTVTIASLDIGGGTTDLMICSYQYEQGANATVLTPIPEFWEGFNLAGDDILRSVIEKIIIPSMQLQLEALIPVEAAAEIIGVLFGKNHGGQSAEARIVRKHFANQVAVPMAQEMLEYTKSESVLVEPKKYTDFFVNYHRPQRQVEKYIEDYIQRAGVSKFKLDQLTWDINPVQVNQVVSEVMRHTLSQLSGIIGQYKCDFMLLAGRPSTLPVIREMILKSLPVSPDRLIPLGNYQIGNWYPYANAKGVLTDPKTCVAVGATISLVGGELGKLMGFRLDTRYLKSKVKSTANYIGYYDEKRVKLRNEDIVFEPDEDSKEIIFHAPVMLGMRQLNDDSWRATPIYHLSYANDVVAADIARLAPFNMTLERHPRNPELISRISGVTRVEGGQTIAPSKFKIKLQTLPEEHGHWLDTGSFLVAQY